jgi:hypothetical protein
MKAAKTKGNLELFSHLAHFLHFIGRQFTRATTAFQRSFQRKRVNVARNIRFTTSFTFAFT